jgi:DNA-binding NarL/FixJ family response regulator
VTKVLVIDDHPLFGEALCEAVALALPDVEAVAVTAIDAAIHEISKASGGFDLILLDLMLPDLMGVEGLAEIKARFRELPILVISEYYSHRLARWLFTCGARGFLTKSENKSEIAIAARKVIAGKLYISRPVRHNLQVLPDFELDQIFKRMSWLSPKEIRVLSRLRKGFRNKDIAKAFDVSEKTIKAQMTSTMRKLDVNNRTQAASEFSNMGFEQLVSQLFLDH